MLKLQIGDLYIFVEQVDWAFRKLDPSYRSEYHLAEIGDYIMFLGEADQFSCRVLTKWGICIEDTTFLSQLAQTKALFKFC